METLEIGDRVELRAFKNKFEVKNFKDYMEKVRKMIDLLCWEKAEK